MQDNEGRMAAVYHFFQGVPDQLQGLLDHQQRHFQEGDPPQVLSGQPKH